MLIQPRSKVAPLSLRFFPDALVISIVHREEVYLSEAARAGERLYREVRTQERVLYELVAEGEYEEKILRQVPQAKRGVVEGKPSFRWRFPIYGTAHPDTVRTSLPPGDGSGGGGQMAP